MIDNEKSDYTFYITSKTIATMLKHGALTQAEADELEPVNFHGKPMFMGKLPSPCKEARE